MAYERLFSGFRLKQFELRNRIAVLPYGTAIVSNGAPLEGDVAHYEKIARSGPGLMFSGATIVHASSAMRNHIVTEAYDPRIIPHLRHKVDVLHSHGVVLFGQILHLGREWALGDADIPPMAPSPIRSSSRLPRTGATTRTAAHPRSGCVSCSRSSIRSGRTVATVSG
jgi:2,4-dienoyl-CoA reductase (NADPH2)